jgi:hypothetical protein
MTEGKAGDRLVLESEKTGHPAREGRILEVHKSLAGISYRVRWTDGHESTFFPSAGSVQILEESKEAGA